MEPTLMVVGINHRAAAIAMRERFWLTENRRYQALRQLKSAEGVEEVLVLCTRCRTEFLLWADDAILAANSLVHYLSSEHGLKLSEWEHFYRRLDEAALTHIFRTACSLDCTKLCGYDAVSNLTAAWDLGRTMGATGAHLNAVLEKALAVSERVRTETAIGKIAISLPGAVLDLVRSIFRSLEGRQLLLLDAGPTSQASARLLADDGVRQVVVIDQSAAHAQEVAQRLGGTAATPADRWRCLLGADIVITAGACPHVVLAREEAERIARERNRVPLVIIDIGLPRDVDPEVRRVDGILLYDFDGLEAAIQVDAAEHTAAAAEAEKIVAAEVRAFRWPIQAESSMPSAVALRRRLDEICREEAASFARERGPFTREQYQLLHAFMAEITRGIASSVARELRELPEREERERIAAAVTCLFHLNSPLQGPSGNKLQKGGDEAKQPAAINY